MTKIYKLMARGDYEAGLRDGSFPVSQVDARDGYVHLSTAEQAPETASKWFAGVADLLALQFDVARLEAVAGVTLTWEPSRGGALFPHLYAPLPPSAVEAVHPAPLDADGAPRPPALPA